MSIMPQMRQAIIGERRNKESYAATEFPALVESGQGQEVLEALVFFSEPAAFSRQVEEVLAVLDGRMADAGPEVQRRCLTFLTDLTMALSSFLPRWNLLNKVRHPQALDESCLQPVIKANKACLARWETMAPLVAKNLLADVEMDTVSRLEAEKAVDPRAVAEDLVGCSLVGYVERMAEAVAHSNLRRVAEMRDSGQIRTEIGNDYAAFLQYAMYLGASFVTTNPVLVAIAWNADPGYWNTAMDAVIATHPDADEAALARLCTLEVVLANMRLLRPIFLLTEGEMGCVSLQVNPKSHGDAQGMISDVLSIYDELKVRLGGGIPNVVFKLPGTLAGLKACWAVTSQGIGVNITVNFAMFQQLRFAQAIHEGEAIFSCLTEMNGRLAFPVRDELLGKLGELAKYGIDEAKARAAAAWAGVAVVKRMEELLTEKGYDLLKVRPLVASLRIYQEGPGYEKLPSAFPDVTEQVGTSIITVFPDIRHAFDALAQVVLDPHRIQERVPDGILEVLSHSEVFRQAYYVADSVWVSDDRRFKPEHELVLEDEEKVFAYPPIYNTMVQFGEGYDQFVQRILERRALLGLDG